MKIVHDLPPILQAILDAGMAPRLEYAAFCYGDELYIPGGWTPSEDLMAHEQTHSFQHADTEGGPDAWWERYIDDQYFRIAQEAEAYAVQYRFVARKGGSRDRLAKYIYDLSAQLAGPMYGNVIGQRAAMKMIREKAGL